jgi:hypothetical protein
MSGSLSRHHTGACFGSLRPIEEHIRPSADHFLSMTFPFCGRAFFPSGIGTADETIAFGKKGFVYLITLATSFICFRIIASATLAIGSRYAPCLQQTLCCPMRIRTYAYDQIEQALDDLSTGGCDAFMRLAPVTRWFVRDRPRFKVVETGIMRERLGVCVRKGDRWLREAIESAQATVLKDGALAALIGQWLGEEATAP